ETICLKCLEKDPARRYASAEELADDLSRFLSGQTVRARRAGLLERAVKWMRRRPSVAALAAVVLAAAALLGVGYWQAARALTRQARDRQRERYPADVEQAHEAVTARKFADARRLLDGTLAEQRGWEWHYLSGLCDGRVALEW